jgi:hypothetical protein
MWRWGSDITAAWLILSDNVKQQELDLSRQSLRQLYSKVQIDRCTSKGNKTICSRSKSVQKRGLEKGILLKLLFSQQTGCAVLQLRDKLRGKHDERKNKPAVATSTDDVERGTGHAYLTLNITGHDAQ